MVTGARRRRSLHRFGVTLVCAGLGAAAAACSRELTPPRSDDPLLYMILSHDGQPGSAGADSSVTGLLASTAGPLSARYRTASRLTMTRLSDGAPFAWQQLDRAGPVTPFPGLSIFLPEDGNLALVESASAQGLGRRDLADGESYAVDLDTEGQHITGRVTIPGQPTISTTAQPEGVLVAWRDARFAALYWVHYINGERSDTLTTDSSLLVRHASATGASVALRLRVIALDSNVAAFASDTTLSRAGLTGAYGVLGATSAAEVTVNVRGP
jgi:hypothetical protein